MEEKIKQLIAEAENDPNVLALIPVGSWGKGAQTKYSDFDCVLIVKNEKEEEYKKHYKDYGYPEIDLSVLSLVAFKNYASVGSTEEWNRYNYANVTPVVDKTNGEAQKVIDEKATFPKDKTKGYVSGSLDAYINQVYRSLKNYRDGNNIAGLLDAAESIPFILNAVFALHGRVRPYNKYLVTDIEKRPLEKLSIDGINFIGLISEIITKGDTEKQKQLFRLIEPIFKKEGFSSTLEGWREKLSWIKS